MRVVEGSDKDDAADDVADERRDEIAAEEVGDGDVTFGHDVEHFDGACDGVRELPEANEECHEQDHRHACGFSKPVQLQWL